MPQDKPPQATSATSAAVGTLDSSGLSQRHAVVTGAGQGIGKVIAQTLAQAGVRVTLMGRRLKTLQATQAELVQSQQHQAVVCDVSDQDSVTKAFAAARDGLGAIDILVNNAGQAQSSSFATTSIEMWQNMLAVNLTGTFLCTQAALPDMLERNQGRIVNIASSAAQKAYAYVSAYVAAKHGVLGLTRSLALELAQANKAITVNAVCPGFTETALLQDSVDKIVASTGRDAEAVREQLARMNPQKRLIQPQEVAQAVLWLCLDSSFGMTGQALSVSGGEVMG